MAVVTGGLLMFKRQSEREEMFYLMTHSTHFIYSYMAVVTGGLLMFKRQSEREEMFYLMTHSTHFIWCWTYGKRLFR